MKAPNNRHLALKVLLAAAMGSTALCSAALTNLALADDDQGAMGETIFVTARKRQETLLEVPLSVKAYNQDQIESLGAIDIGQLSNFTPGFDFQETGQGGASGRENPNIRFRGVGVQNSNPASRGGAIFYEGSYLAAGAGLFPLFDIERIEIIKGPQNAFYGRNTFAGAVNFLPKEPGDELEGFANVLYSPSDQDTYQGSAALTIPITDGLSTRVGFFYERVGADYEYENGDPLNQEERPSPSKAP